MRERLKEVREKRKGNKRSITTEMHAIIASHNAWRTNHSPNSFFSNMDVFANTILKEKKKRGKRKAERRFKV
jgi:hypothetical protein